ncbi:MAG: hypothetical protein NZ528_08430 [Caldilineales bacterium]|nr:hypothetical protein [Caldilineales bacterium]MDW8318625.1 hypothetical protein [Anaerolineae bacterium]
MLSGLLGGARLLASTGRVQTPMASLVPTDAGLGVPGRPQSATGQAALLTGLNAPQLVGGHYGPRPHAPLRELLRQTIFSRALALGFRVTLVNAYPQAHLDAVASGRRVLGAIPFAAQAAGIPLRTADDLVAGRALSPDITNVGWHNIGYPNMPVRSPAEAGAILARLSADYDLTFFDDWFTDVAGHEADCRSAVETIEARDAFLGGLLNGLDLCRTLVVVTSDHGNLEDCTHRNHTEHLVPTLLIGAAHRRWADRITRLTDIAEVVLEALAAEPEG